MNDKHSNKDYVLKLLKEKDINGLSFSRISELTGYSKQHLIRLFKQLEEKDIETLIKHSAIGKTSNHVASELEVNYIVEFKKQYPNISISQFQDYFHEQILWNKFKQEDVIKYNLKQRSYSFFASLYKKYNWVSPCKRKKIKGKKTNHSLRDPMPKKGMLIMMDGTPHDWFNNGNKFSLHLAIDDATGEYLCGWFEPTETLYGYCKLLTLLLLKYGIPENIYTDKHMIFKSPIEFNLTNFGKMCEDIGINQILANSAEAKGKIERANRTIQGRLLNDIKTNNIKTYSELNDFFNNQYCDYLNRKFAYNLEKESVFVTLEENQDIQSIFCIRTKRKFLRGNVVSYKDVYYKAIDGDNKVVHLYVGTEVEVRENIFTNEVTIKYGKTIYKTQIYEKRNRKDKVQTIINDQKDLLNYFENK